jgi:transposase InsO family protein
MPWKTMDVREQRVSFVVTASRGERSFSALCQEYGISRPTGYEWLSRYRRDGVNGIVERSRRPLLSPGQTASELELQVVAMRQRYPDWGARKLQVLLCRRGLHLPTTTIHRILVRHDLVRELDRRRAATQRFERSAANELWQMDFKGPLQRGDKLGPLSVLDDHSRYLVALQQVESTSGEQVREHLERAFGVAGVPDAMLMDHGTPWWGRMAPQGLTRLALWMMKQGIELHWSRVRHPQTQGKVERFHGELQRAMDYRQPATKNLQPWLDWFRWEHNHVRPHEALGMQTPAEHWKPSPRRYDSNPPAWQYPEGSRVLKVDSEGKIKLHRQHWLISLALSGEYVQLVTIEQRVLVYYCNTLMRELDLPKLRSTIVDRSLQQDIFLDQKL